MSDASPIDLIPAEQDISMELRTTSTLQGQDISKTNPTERADERCIWERDIAFYYDKSYVGCPYEALVYDTKQYFFVTRQTMTYLNQPYPAELLRLVTHPKIQRMIYGFTLRARKYSHVAPSTVSSNWSGKWSLPHYRVASPLGMSSDNWERDISRIQRVDHLGPYTEIRRVVRRPIDATILRVCKWTNLIGNEMLYGENLFIFRMCNGSFYDSPPTLLRENVLIRPNPAKPKLDKTWFKNVKLGMVQVESGTHMRQLLGWVYYDGFLRFLHSIGSKNAALITRLKFCGTILIHKCDFECSPRCDDDLLKSIRPYVPFIEKFCPNLRTLTLCVRLDPKCKTTRNDPRLFRESLDPLFKREIRKIVSLQELMVNYKNSDGCMLNTHQKDNEEGEKKDDNEWLWWDQNTTVIADTILWFKNRVKEGEKEGARLQQEEQKF